MGCWGGGLVIVHTITLHIALHNITDFVMDDVAIVVSFALADKLAFQWSTAMWDVRMGDEDEHVQVSQAVELFLSSSKPVLMFHGLHCCHPGQIIIRVKVGLCRAIRKRR
jgi:hypothetical protein